MLESVRPDEIGRYQHLIIEPVDRAVQVRLVVADLDRWNCAYRLQMSESRAYASRKGAVQALQFIALAGVPTAGSATARRILQPLEHLSAITLARFTVCSGRNRNE